MNQPSLLEEISFNEDYVSETLFFEGDTFLQTLLQSIQQAQQFILFESYIIEKGECWEKILSALVQASERGVQVRVLVDGIGTPDWTHETLFELQQKGLEAKIYNPYPWVRWGFRQPSQSLGWKRFWIWMKLLNRRDHRKVCVIDGRKAFVGSRNVSDLHLESIVGKAAWKDISVQLENLDLTPLIFAFEKAWFRAVGLSKRSHYSFAQRWREWRQRRYYKRPISSFRLNYNHYLKKRFYEELLNRLYWANEAVWIMTAYFSPRRSFLKALRAAAWAGVDVRIVIPQKSDVRMARWIGTLFFRPLLRAGVKIYEYQSSVLHSKTMRIDDWYVLGSSNLNLRSLKHDLETDVVLQQESSIKKLRDHFLSIFDQSQQIQLHRFEKSHLWERFWGRLVAFLRYWM
ncbi:MAG: phosphatidylserine/phosphatidylglycerophosphate/cardiolipin synthase family protein [Deltaproteobacteria bacterium]|nr:phosphatidylserine/phosphatidylglycerophosphate/cardiolipin synthase family protein [Deltaproteobacteria bacterium]